MGDIKRKAFIRAYLGEAQGNATKAAVIAGYSEHTAAQQGSRLLTKAEVLQAIQRKLEKADLSTDAALQNVARIANAQPEKITGGDVVKANELILKVNGALKEKDTGSRITVNIGFLNQPAANVQVSVSDEQTINATVTELASPARPILPPA